MQLGHRLNKPVTHRTTVTDKDDPFRIWEPRGKVKRHGESIQENQKEPFKELAYAQLNFKISMDQ